VQDWLEKFSLCEENPEFIMDQMQNPQYRNVLKMVQQQAMPFWQPAQMMQQPQQQMGG